MFQVTRSLYRTSSRGKLGSIIRYITMETEWPVKASIMKKLTESFQPTYLDVINESSMHNVPRGSETHFKVIIVSERFEEENLLKRHRLVNEVLKEELDGSVHALSIQAKTPSQWSLNATTTKSPRCLGGMAREQAQQDKRSPVKP